MTRKPVYSKELKLTLSQLEGAIKDWDGLISEKVGVPEETPSRELSERTQALLKKLREQIDELSE